MNDVAFRSMWTKADREDALYRSLPFDVPAGAPGVVVDVRYEKTPTAALDVGLSDPRGFRGWSGSSRQRIELSAGHATPGYLRGPIVPGRWNVEIGLHRIPDPGIEVEIAVSFVEPALTAAAGRVVAASGPVARTLPAPPGTAWLAGDFRAHSEHSDGTEPIVELATRAVQAGLDFLVVADFNTVSHYPEIADLDTGGAIAIIPGQTIAIDTGHATVLGVEEWIDLREDPALWSRRVRSLGGLVSANHPTRRDSAWRTPLAGGVDLAEIWSGGWDGRDGAPLAWWLAAGSAVVPVGGSGWTGRDGAAELGRPVTWVLCANGDVIQGLRDGRTAISATIDGPAIVRLEDEIAVLGGAGHRLVDWRGKSVPVARDDERFEALPTPYFLRDSDDRTVALCA